MPNDLGNEEREIGKTERETVMNQLKLASGYISLLVEQVKKLNTAIVTVGGVLKAVDKNDALYDAESKMKTCADMLDGVVRSFMGATGFGQYLNTIKKKSDLFRQEAEGLEPIKTTQLTKTLAVEGNDPLDPGEIDKFHEAINAILTAREELQAIYNKHYPKDGVLVQLKIALVDKDNSKIISPIFDIEGYLRSIVSSIIQEKIEKGEVVGLTQKGDENAGNLQAEHTCECH